MRKGANVVSSADDIPDLRGRVAVVTGANGGLGLETARELARNGATVVMAVRDVEKAERARASIEADVVDAHLEIVTLDLASLTSVRACAQHVSATHAKVDVLVNNAGLMGIPEQTTADGFEMQLGVNHLGHFVLTRHLLPRLLTSGAGRIVSVTSFGRLVGTVPGPDDPHMRRRYDPWRAYGRSKIANLFFAVELQRRLEAAGARAASFIAHPGLAHTDLQARGVRETGGGLSQRFWHAVAGAIGMSPDRAALPLLRAATDPEADPGRMYSPRWMTFGAPVHRPLVAGRLRKDAARRLWEVSEHETGEHFDVAAIVGEFNR
jgi:NAD(P)-dependent dehydrogenase (short-subunit alcohol dehydrogenase family)